LRRRVRHQGHPHLAPRGARPVHRRRDRGEGPPPRRDDRRLEEARPAAVSTLDARDNLNHIARHWPDLQHALGGLRSTPTDKITVTTSSDPQAPINLHVLDLMAEVSEW